MNVAFPAHGDGVAQAFCDKFDGRHCPLLAGVRAMLKAASSNFAKGMSQLKPAC